MAALESCMILLDCSQYMRNGDYVPTRLEAQMDAANLLVSAKTMNHESTVGISAGSELLVSPTSDIGKILGAIHSLSVQSTTSYDVMSSVQIASLALKHRRNKNGSQRIVLFVGTPLVDAEVRAFQKTGRQLKKNNVAIDIIALGEFDSNESKLRELVDAANNSNNSDDGERNCHLVTIPAGVLPSEVLASSPILTGGAGGGGAFAAAAAVAAANSSGAGGSGGDNPFAEFGGVDPNLDPELAMALRVSIEEERARQERLAEQAAVAAAAATASTETTGGDGGAGNTDTEMADAAATTAASSSAAGATAGLTEEEEMLQKALTMSMEENTIVPADGNVATSAVASGSIDDVEMDDDDDAAMQMALAMSMQQDGVCDDTATASFQDPSFVQQLLAGTVDPEIQQALLQQQQKDAADAEKKGDDSKSDEK
jgi:26S proteasome regulatory subunit N10